MGLFRCVFLFFFGWVFYCQPCIKVYKAKYPETVIPKRQYQCRICGIAVSHYASPISGHLSGRHNITMTDYYLRYEQVS